MIHAKKTKPALWTKLRAPVMVRVAVHRKRIAARSRSMAGKMRRYRRLKLEYLSANPHCQCQTQACKAGLHAATEIHHTRGRAGALLLDTRHWRGVCRKSHDWIHHNPTTAKQLGYIAGLGQWGKEVDKS